MTGWEMIAAISFFWWQGDCADPVGLVWEIKYLLDNPDYPVSDLGTGKDWEIHEQAEC